MHVPQPTSSIRLILTRPSVLVVTLTAISVVLYFAIAHRLPPSPSGQAATPVSNAMPSAGPVAAEVITSKATDKHEYLSDVLRQLSEHPQATCRDEVSGPQGLQEELRKAGALKAQGQLQDASLMLTAIEKRLDRKFQLECLKLG